MRGIHFISYGNNNFSNSVQRICREAYAFGGFTSITAYTETHLRTDREFWDAHGRFIENNPRGSGYWIWKPYLIQKKLNEMSDGDFLVYCDAGCEINPNGKQRFLEYIDMLETNEDRHGVLSFTMPLQVGHWTKNAIFEYFKCENSIRQLGQNIATIIIIHKNTHSMHLIDLWNKSMLYHLINDVTGNEHPEFIENRHDQSIFSVLVNTYGSVKLPDETYFTKWDEGRNYPFLAKRIRG
jgi:hypothetical protein